MKYLLAILLIIDVLPAFSQKGAGEEQKALIGTTRDKLTTIRGRNNVDSLDVITAVDSLRLKAGQKIDSLNSKIGGAAEQIPTRLGLDTLKGVTCGETVIKKTNSIQHATDAVLSTFEQKLNKSRNTIIQKADSVTALLEGPAQVINQKIDSALNRVTVRIDSIERKMMGAVEKTESKIQEKVMKVDELLITMLLLH